jgi:sugar O-acyltransferase (sialic acid O-acetyltransferase NeuD family)
MTRLVGVYGSSGCGRGILPILRDRLAGQDATLVFIDDALHYTEVNGQHVFSWQGFLNAAAAQKGVCLAIADSQVREKLADKCEGAGISLIEARASNVVVMDEVAIGHGACLSPFVTLTSNIRIGRCFHANLYSYVEHDCVIGDFVTFAPGAKCNGNVHIEDHAYIGSGAVIKQGTREKPLRIGRGAIVGMGAVVTRDVPAGATVVGNPAGVLTKDF